MDTLSISHDDRNYYLSPFIPLNSTGSRKPGLAPSYDGPYKEIYSESDYGLAYDGDKFVSERYFKQQTKHTIELQSDRVVHRDTEHYEIQAEAERSESPVGKRSWYNPELSPGDQWGIQPEAHGIHHRVYQVADDATAHRSVESRIKDHPSLDAETTRPERKRNGKELTTKKEIETLTKDDHRVRTKHESLHSAEEPVKHRRRTQSPSKRVPRKPHMTSETNEQKPDRIKSASKSPIKDTMSRVPKERDIGRLVMGSSQSPGDRSIERPREFEQEEGERREVTTSPAEVPTKKPKPPVATQPETRTDRSTGSTLQTGEHDSGKKRGSKRSSERRTGGLDHLAEPIGRRREMLHGTTLQDAVKSPTLKMRDQSDDSLSSTSTELSDGSIRLNRNQECREQTASKPGKVSRSATEYKDAPTRKALLSSLERGRGYHGFQNENIHVHDPRQPTVDLVGAADSDGKADKKKMNLGREQRKPIRQFSHDDGHKKRTSEKVPKTSQKAIQPGVSGKESRLSPSKEKPTKIHMKEGEMPHYGSQLRGPTPPQDKTRIDSVRRLAPSKGRDFEPHSDRSYPISRDKYIQSTTQHGPVPKTAQSSTRTTKVRDDLSSSKLGEQQPLGPSLQKAKKEHLSSWLFSYDDSKKVSDEQLDTKSPRSLSDGHKLFDTPTREMDDTKKDNGVKRRRKLDSTTETHEKRVPGASADLPRPPGADELEKLKSIEHRDSSRSKRDSQPKQRGTPSEDKVTDTDRRRGTHEKSDDPMLVGRKRHPPPPTSPTSQRPPNFPTEISHEFPLPAYPEQPLNGLAQPKYPTDERPSDRRQARDWDEIGPARKDRTHERDSRRGRITGHPDEYNLVDEAERRRYGLENPEIPRSAYADMTQGRRRRIPDQIKPGETKSIKTDDHQTRPEQRSSVPTSLPSAGSVPAKHDENLHKPTTLNRTKRKKESSQSHQDSVRRSNVDDMAPGIQPDKPNERHDSDSRKRVIHSGRPKQKEHEATLDGKQRHPPPPKATHRTHDPYVNGFVGRSKMPSDSLKHDKNADYVNIPISRDQHLEEGAYAKSQETSDRSNEPNSYDPRVNDIVPVARTQKKRDRHRHDRTRYPVTARHDRVESVLPTPPTPPPEVHHGVRRDRVEQNEEYDDEDDDDDLDDSDEDLKPPALQSIPQTKKSAESLVRSKQPPPDVVRLRHPPHGRRSSPQRGSLLSPTGSLPGSHRRYRPEQFHAHHYEQHDRVSRPQTKRDTPTSDRHGAAGSKHSLIISTKRRTLSGVTGMNPTYVRSSSMNALWFGDHPVPSNTATSPTLPVRLSAIQLQAQAELERRHRPSSRAHSLDRRSGHSVAGTASRLSRTPTEVEPYEGIGYGYDTRGRLIHGGAHLRERSASRKRRLRDGHESLSRVWIPQGDTSPTRLTTDMSPGAMGDPKGRKANLDASAVAFALRDFTAPGVR